ncbi:uncharacterized protein LOC110990011 isoform X1 [Acanthaster planci]|uniref:Uncharacterized protein LOC110990011 isoform X1 n=1 Tax=Acanthaster planci TaxID=133434 RepID=A0A8B7ZZD6_ACAPL|nr:uncharacterized protein LOC110990011 isoform X1 [Acanthaster planci]
MPRRKSAGSLQDVCLRFIAKNLLYWTEHYEEYYLGQGVYRFVLGPFNQLNSQLSEDLLTFLVKQQQLSRSALHLLLYGGALQNLDLSSCSRIVNDEVVRIVTSSCKMLQVLNLSYCKRVTSAGFIAIATSLPQLSTLNATKTNLRGLAAQSVFKYCCRLKDLSLKHCHIGDQDIMVLCEVAPNQLSGTQLKRLDISYTLITERGVRAILQGMPELQILQYPSLLTCLFDSHESETGCLDPVLKHSECFQLRSLQCEDFMSVCNGMLQAIPDLCPHVTQLDLRFAGGFDNEGLFHLAQLHNLKDLQLCCEESENITFRCGIMPVLLEIGHNLKVLSLQDIGGLDPAMVCQLCPNLRKLFLLMMKEGKVFSSLGGIPNNSKLQPMTGLIELDFWCQNGDISLSEEALGLLLTNCIALESLGLIRIDTLTDNVLRSVLRKNSFSNLKQLSVHECHCITQETLSELLSATSNQLEFVKLINCLQITRKDYETWEKTAKRENFNIKLEWK